MAITLKDYQLKAIDLMKNGCILNGSVGSGKSLTSLTYFIIKECKGGIKITGKGGYYKKMENPKNLYIITTAKKRDSLEWEKECSIVALNKDPSISHSGVKVTIDSWNNIKKYKKIIGAFFIFDEQRVVGSGEWVKSFLDITKKNHWILLSATPGDTWSDYIPVFIANGFYKNRSDFTNQHCIYSRFSKFPKIERYIGEEKLNKLRDNILIPMEDRRKTERIIINEIVDYDKNLFKTVYRDRWDPYDNCPIEECGKWIYLMRRVINSDSSRISRVKEILLKKERAIIFYNFNYELELLENMLIEEEIKYKQWNGKKHEEIPRCKRWAYLVQYSAGSEGWNCIATDTIIFFSQSYSYRQIEQASGRIDRMDTGYNTLYYYHIRSKAFIDLMIYNKLKDKKDFNDRVLSKKF